MDAVYRRLVSFYPSSFRARFGEELLQFVRDERAHGRRAHWLRTCADLFGSALIERGRQRAMRTKLAVALFMLVLMGGGTLAVIGNPFDGLSVVSLSVGLITIGLTVAAITIGARSERGAEHDYAGRKFRWWWIPAGVVGAFEAVVGVGLLIHEPKKENAFALVVLFGFAALMFGGMAVARRQAGNWMIATGALPMLPVFWLIVPTAVALLVIVMALSDIVRLSNKPRVAV